MKNNHMQRVAPFMLFMTFIGLEELLHLLAKKGIIFVSTPSTMYFYPIKALSVGLLLIVFRSYYHELKMRDLLKSGDTLVSMIIGIAVFLLWIKMDWGFATQGNPAGFNPTLIEDNATRTVLIFTRITGAVMVVPIMEELFWRSFLIRYMINQSFLKVSIGKFSWQSFLVTSILFGLEHNYILAGIMAAIAFNFLLYYTKSIAQCILAHAITNLALGLYVLDTQQWRFW